MEGRQKDQEASSTTEGNTGNLPQGSPVRSPDVVNRRKLYLPVDNETSTRPSLTQYPETLIKENTSVESWEKLQNAELSNEDLGYASERILCDVSVNGDEARAVFTRNEQFCFEEIVKPDPTEERTVVASRSLTQDLRILGADDYAKGSKRSREKKEIRNGFKRDQYEEGAADIAASNSETNEVLESTPLKETRGLKDDSTEQPEIATWPSATKPRSRLDMDFLDAETANRSDVIFSRDPPSNLGGRSTGSAAEERFTSRSRGPGGSLWRVLSGRFCRGFRICNWFPKMCSCLDGGSSMSGNCSSGHGGSYERLGSGPTLFEFSNIIQRARRRAGSKGDEFIDNEKQAELTFYNVDQTGTKVCVERNLRTMDLCELLKVKRNAAGNAWSIVETWPELGIERTLEDHEDILATHREMEMFASHHERKFYFRKDFLKYEFFVSPKQFFPAEMVAFPNDEDRGSGDVEETLRSYLARNDAECPQVFSLVWLRDERSSTWKKTYMLLQGRKLYTTKKALFPSTKFLRSCLASPKVSSQTNCSHHKSMSPDHDNSISTSSRPSTLTRPSDRLHHTNTGTLPKRNLDHEQLSPLAHLSDYHVYKIPNAKRYFNAPFEWGACLRPSSNAEAEDTEAGVPGLKVIAFTSEKSRACWLTAMRLAKYGKQLRENYRAFRNKQCEQNGGSGSPKEQYSSYNVPNESLRSRVAMDFTGSVGRIVEDPKEAKDIAESEGIIWRRRWRPFSRPPPGCAMVRLHGLDGGIHVLQPWFHSGLNRDIAAAIIKEHGSVDGVFLVRESKSNPGAYVLTYKYSEKVFHAQIQPIYDERRNCWLYTLDKGATKFYDLLQLIEFYQLNSGSLPTRLTHYVQNGVTVAQQRQEDGGASPSPPFTSNQNISPKSDCPKSSSGI